MQDQNIPQRPLKRSVRSIPVSIIAGISAAILVAGSGAAWWTWNSITAKKTSVTSPSVSASSQPTALAPDSTQSQPSPQPSPVSAQEQVVQIYWLKDTGSHLELTPSSIKVSGKQPTLVLKAAFEELLAGPKQQTIASTIPLHTRLLDVAVQTDGIHVNLSKEFTSGGGSASMSGRLAQIIYTATTLNPNAKVWISIEGRPLETLGGEGLIIDQPMSRTEFNQNFSL
jgi:spore germination protein GerM